ncbi:MAG: hypothetical protein R3B06_09250 [Kofleriaceae bacterium]
MTWLTIIALIAAGILALSSFIISNKPQAKELIDKLVPFQGAIGVALLVLGAYLAIDLIQHSDALTRSGFPLSILIAYLLCAGGALGLGFLFGMPLVAKWIPGESPAEQKAMEMQQKLAPYQTLLGVVALVGAALRLYVRFKYKG